MDNMPFTVSLSKMLDDPEKYHGAKVIIITHSGNEYYGYIFCSLNKEKFTLVMLDISETPIQDLTISVKLTKLSVVYTDTIYILELAK